MWEVTKQTVRAGIRGTAALALALVIGQSAAAQNLFAPVARVNDEVITGYEVQQRQRFMQLIGAPGADTDSVIDSLIDDRLRGPNGQPIRPNFNAGQRAALVAFLEEERLK